MGLMEGKNLNVATKKRFCIHYKPEKRPVLLYTVVSLKGFHH